MKFDKLMESLETGSFLEPSHDIRNKRRLLKRVVRLVRPMIDRDALSILDKFEIIGPYIANESLCVDLQCPGHDISFRINMVRLTCEFSWYNRNTAVSRSFVFNLLWKPEWALIVWLLGKILLGDFDKDMPTIDRRGTTIMWDK